MTVSNVSSAYGTCQNNVQSIWQKRAQDFKALQTALQSGDLTGAQQAFASLQNDKSGSTQASSSTNPANNQTNPLAKDFEALQSALTSGDLSGAQQAFTTLQQDMQSARGAHHHHHHHHSGSSDGSQTATTAVSGTTSTSQAVQGLNQLA